MYTDKKMNFKSHEEQEKRLYSIAQMDSQPIVITISSGKGGVGKTVSTIQMALSASSLGYKVLILDGDLGLSNVDVVLGLEAKNTIDDVFNYDLSLDKIILDGPNNIKVISSGSGITGLEKLSPIKKQILSNKIDELQESFDIIFIDTGAGIGSNVLHLNKIAHERIIITTSEPHAVTDSYALIKILSEEYQIENLNLMINMVKSPQEGMNLAQKLGDICDQYLNKSINYIGSIPSDPNVSKQILRQKVNSPNRTKTISGQAWDNITKKMIHSISPSNLKQKDLFQELFYC